MLTWLKSKLTTRQAPPAEQQLAAIAGVTDFLTPLSYREAESYLPAVIACTNYISHALATLPARVCRRDGTRKEVVTDASPVGRLLRNPNPHLSGGLPELLLIASHELLAYGNCVIVIDTIDSEPTLTPIPWIYVTAPYREYNAGYRVTWPGGVSEALPASRVIHVKIGCADGGWIGRSPLARNANSVALNKLVERATSGLWSNGCYPSLALKTSKILQPAQREQARQSLITQLSKENRGKPMFLDADFSLEQVSANSKDLQHLEQRLYGVVQICQLYGLSPVLVSDLRFGTYSNYSQARQAFAHETLSIYQRLFSEAFSSRLLPDSDEYVELDSSHLLQTRTEKVTEISSLVQAGVLSPDEAKKELGYG